MLSQSHLIGSERRSCDHLIGSERRSCDHLPSKQAVAGSSPVSRSSLYTVALEVLHRPLYRKRAVMSKRDGGCFHGRKASNGHLPPLFALPHQNLPLSVPIPVFSQAFEDAAT